MSAVSWVCCIVVLFSGTFEAEKEEVAYGLTHPLNTFEAFEVQVNIKNLFYYSWIWFGDIIFLFWYTMYKIYISYTSLQHNL